MQVLPRPQQLAENVAFYIGRVADYLKDPLVMQPPWNRRFPRFFETRNRLIPLGFLAERTAIRIEERM